MISTVESVRAANDYVKRLGQNPGCADGFEEQYILYQGATRNMLYRMCLDFVMNSFKRKTK